MIVAVSDFNMGAMENKGLNIFNDKYVLASPETATDADYERIEAIIAHEYFHNWTGNRITCRDWFQLCLKEGLTVFRDQEFSADERSRAVERIGDVRGLRAHQFVEDAGPLAHPVRPRALSRDQQFLHRDRLREGRRGRAHAQDAARRRTSSARAWTSISSATTARPRRSRSSCNASPTSRARPRAVHALVLAGRHARGRRHRQPRCARARPTASTSRRPCRRRPGQPSKEPMVIPLAIGLVGRDGRDLPLKLADGRSIERGVLTLTKPAETFVFADIGEPPVPLAQPRIFGADQAHRQPVGRRPAFPRRARQRPVQSLAGAADAGDAPAASTMLRRCARCAARGAARRTRAARRAHRRCSPTARSSRRSSRSC